MWNITGWALITWLKFTVLFALIVGVVWLALGSGSGWFWTAAVAAVGTDLFLARQLSREWRWEASMRWWWTR